MAHPSPDSRFPDPCLLCDSAEELDLIRQPDIELVVWRRPLPPGLQRWLGRLDLTDGPRVCTVVEPQNISQTLQPLLDIEGLPKDDWRDVLVDDLQALVNRFSGVVGTERVELRLECIAGNACWKFHRDNVRARLLTTYFGSATEWVRPVHAERALREQKTYDGPIERLGNDDVALFKGSCAGPRSGIVHRSPPVAGTGHTRLLLCLNPPASTPPLALS